MSYNYTATLNVSQTYDILSTINIGTTNYTILSFFYNNEAPDGYLGLYNSQSMTCPQLWGWNLNPSNMLSSSSITGQYFLNNQNPDDCYTSGTSLTIYYEYNITITLLSDQQSWLVTSTFSGITTTIATITVDTPNNNYNVYTVSYNSATELSTILSMFGIYLFFTSINPSDGIVFVFASLYQTIKFVS